VRRLAGLPAGDLDEILPRVHRVISNLKTWLQGTQTAACRRTTCRSTSTSTSCASTGAERRWPPSRACSGSVASSPQRRTARSTPQGPADAPPCSTPQPPQAQGQRSGADKHDAGKHSHRAPGAKLRRRGPGDASAKACKRVHGLHPVRHEGELDGGVEGQDGSPEHGAGVLAGRAQDVGEQVAGGVRDKVDVGFPSKRGDFLMPLPVGCWQRSRSRWGTSWPPSCAAGSGCRSPRTTG